MIQPDDRESEKKHCPPAEESTLKNPFALPQALRSGLNRNFSPGPAPGSVQDLTTTMSSMKNSNGIATLQNFSIPPDTPPNTITIVRSRYPVIHATEFPVLVSSPPNCAPGSAEFRIPLPKSARMESPRYLVMNPPNVQ